MYTFCYHLHRRHIINIICLLAGRAWGSNCYFYHTMRDALHSASAIQNELVRRDEDENWSEESQSKLSLSFHYSSLLIHNPDQAQNASDTWRLVVVVFRDALPWYVKSNNKQRTLRRELTISQSLAILVVES